MPDRYWSSEVPLFQQREKSDQGPVQRRAEADRVHGASGEPEGGLLGEDPVRIRLHQDEANTEAAETSDEVQR